MSGVGSDHYNSLSGEWLHRKIKTLDGLAEVTRYLSTREIYLTWEDNSETRTNITKLRNNELETCIKKLGYNEDKKLSGVYLSVCGENLEVVEDLGIYRVFVKSENGFVFKTIRKTLVESRTRLVAECYVGRVFNSNRNGELEIVKALSQKYVEIKWLDTGTLDKARLSHVKAGSVLDKSLANKGAGKLKTIGLCAQYDKDIIDKCTELWQAIVCRAENKSGKNPSYQHVSYDSTVKDFSVFIENIVKKKGFNKEGFELDKDLMSHYLGITPPVYSTKTIVFLPKVLNNLIKVRKKGCGLSKPYTGGKWRVHFKGEYYGGFNSEEDAKDKYEELLVSEVIHISNVFKDDLSEEAYQALMSWSISYE